MEKSKKIEKYWDSRSVLVTGGNGYLGVEIIKTLIDEGANIVSFDKGGSLHSLLKSIKEKIEYISIDLSDNDALSRILKENSFDTCFHLAGYSNIADAKINPLDAFHANVSSVCNLLDAFRRSNSFPFTVLASSNHIYGNQRIYPTPEDAPLNSKEIYGVTKGCGDLIASAYAVSYGLPITIARITNTYGGHEPYRKHLIPYIFSTVSEGKTPVIQDDGKSMKGFLYIRDTVGALKMLAESTEKKEIWGKAFNFYPDKNSSVLDVAKTILNVMGREDIDIEIMGLVHQKHERMVEFLDNMNAKDKLGWKQKTPLEVGIKLALEDYKKYEII